jgi:non-ribosomal peptide synthetase component F
VGFVLQNTPEAALELPDLVLEPLRVERELTRFDLEVSLREVPEGLAGVLLHRSDRLEAAAAADLARRFQILLRGIALDADRMLLDLPVEEEGLLVATPSPRAAAADAEEFDFEVPVPSSRASLEEAP